MRETDASLGIRNALIRADRSLRTELAQGVAPYGLRADIRDWDLRACKRGCRARAAAPPAELSRHGATLRPLPHGKPGLFRLLRNCFIAPERKGRAGPERVMVEGGVEAAAATAPQETLPRPGRAMRARLARPAI